MNSLELVRDGCLRVGRPAGISLMLAVGPSLGASPVPGWAQWGSNPEHTGFSPVAGQPLRAIIADVVYDPFVPQELAEEDGELFVH